jgi:hypothetical protein
VVVYAAVIFHNFHARAFFAGGAMIDAIRIQCQVKAVALPAVQIGDELAFFAMARGIPIAGRFDQLTCYGDNFALLGLDAHVWNLVYDIRDFFHGFRGGAYVHKPARVGNATDIEIFLFRYVVHIMAPIPSG